MLDELIVRRDEVINYKSQISEYNRESDQDKDFL
jgi:hypothetical protein